MPPMTSRRQREGRANTLWGTGPKSGKRRASALWGKRTGFVQVALAVAAVALLAPVAALAAPGGGPGGGPGGAKHAHVDPGLEQQAAANPNGDFRVIVQGDAGTSSDSLTGDVGKARANNHDPRGTAVDKKFKAIHGVAVTLNGDDIEALSHDPNVTAITPDLPIASAAPGPRGGAGQPAFSNSEMWVQDTGMSTLWPLVPYSKLPTIAVVDSGIDPTRLDQGVLASLNLYTGSGPNSAGDGYGHGTMVAGLAALTNKGHAGAAPGAGLVSLDVLDDNGMGTESDAIAAADWILQNKDAYNIKVANFSLCTGSGTSILYDPLDKAVEQLWLSGVTVVAAAGNYGTASGPSGVVTAPGNDPFVITVGAADTNDTASPADDFTAPWSAYGYTPDGFAKPELGAPGRMLYGPVPDKSKFHKQFLDRWTRDGYMWMSGTSFAAPIVSGMADDLIALHPTWTPDQVKGALMVSASPYASSSPQFSLGVGIVNGAAASAVADPPNPNAALDQFATTDAATGLPVFDAASWASAASASAAWGSAAWASAAWGSAAWGSAAWGSAAWGSAAWGSAAWGSAAWGSAAWGSAAWAVSITAASSGVN